MPSLRRALETERAWVAAVLAQARAFRLGDHPTHLGEFSITHQLSCVQSQIQITATTHAMYFHTTNNMNQASMT